MSSRTKKGNCQVAGCSQQATGKGAPVCKGCKKAKICPDHSAKGSICNSCADADLKAAASVPTRDPEAEEAEAAESARRNAEAQIYAAAFFSLPLLVVIWYFLDIGVTLIVILLLVLAYAAYKVYFSATTRQGEVSATLAATDARAAQMAQGEALALIFFACPVVVVIFIWYYLYSGRASPSDPIQL